MPVGLTRTSAPAALFTAAEVRELAKLAGDASDTAVLALAARAVRRVEERTSRGLLNQNWMQVLDAFPSTAPNGRTDVNIRLLKGRVSAVLSVEYRDADGDGQELTEDTGFAVELVAEPARIYPVTSWPATDGKPGCVTVEFTVGYGASRSSVPEDLVQAVLGLIGHWHEHPEAVVTGTIVAEVPMHVQEILSEYELHCEGP